MKKSFLILTVLFVCFTACGKPVDQSPVKRPGTEQDTEKPEAPEEPSDEDLFDILFIGNSLTLDATTLLPDMLNAAGIKSVRMTRVFRGACTLPLYNNNYSSSGFCAIRTWDPGAAFWSGTEALEHSLEEAVEARQYDLICIQEYSGAPCAWTWSDEEKTAVNGVISKIRAVQEDAELAFMFSHSFGTGYERLVNNFGNDNVKQFEACAETIREILKETGIETVVSTAATIQNLRTSGVCK